MIERLIKAVMLSGLMLGLASLPLTILLYTEGPYQIGAGGLLLATAALWAWGLSQIMRGKM